MCKKRADKYDWFLDLMTKLWNGVGLQLIGGNLEIKREERSSKETIHGDYDPVTLQASAQMLKCLPFITGIHESREGQDVENTPNIYVLVNNFRFGARQTHYAPARSGYAGDDHDGVLFCCA